MDKRLRHVRESRKSILVDREHFLYLCSLDAQETHNGGKDCLSIRKHTQTGTKREELTGSDSTSVQLGHWDCSFSFHGPSDASSRLSGTSKTSGAAFRFGFRRVVGEGGDAANALFGNSPSSS